MSKCSFSAITATALRSSSRHGFPLNWRAEYVEFCINIECVFKVALIFQLERHVFEATINRLNEYFAEAEKGSCSTYCEGCLACITAYLVYMCSETHYEKVIRERRGSRLDHLISIRIVQVLRKISKYIISQNERVYNPKGLQVTDPVHRGLRVIEISILDRPLRT